MINSDKLIQEKIKLVFVENIMLDQMPDFAKACDVFNYIPYKTSIFQTHILTHL